MSTTHILCAALTKAGSPCKKGDVSPIGVETVKEETSTTLVKGDTHSTRLCGTHRKMLEEGGTVLYNGVVELRPVVEAQQTLDIEPVEVKVQPTTTAQQELGKVAIEAIRKTVKCGNCGGSHGSAKLVRECYGTTPQRAATVVEVKAPVANSATTGNASYEEKLAKAKKDARALYDRGLKKAAYKVSFWHGGVKHTPFAKKG